MDENNPYPVNFRQYFRQDIAKTWLTLQWKFYVSRFYLENIVVYIQVEDINNKKSKTTFNSKIKLKHYFLTGLFWKKCLVKV